LLPARSCAGQIASMNGRPNYSQPATAPGIRFANTSMTFVIACKAVNP